MRSCLTIWLVYAGSMWGLAAQVSRAPISRLEVAPLSIHLDSSRSISQVTVTGYDEEGHAIDLTQVVDYSLEGCPIITVNNGRIIPTEDGDSRLVIEFDSSRVEVPVSVRNYHKADPVCFKTEAIAVLTKAGCNAGSCHGSPQGKAGFSLSLFGFDPLQDLEAIVRDGFNRRVHLLDPEESLILKKPLLRVPHVGGKRLKPGTTSYEILYRWIQEGASGGSADQPECVGIEILPAKHRVLRFPDLHQQLSIQAHFDDGTLRNVTHLVRYETSNASIVTVDESGWITGQDRGVAAVTVRYLEFFESVTVTVVRNQEGFVWNPPPENNVVDRLVNQQLQLLDYEAASTCDDSTFVRRVHLDLTGLLPSSQVSREFVADSAPDKREKLIDTLLASHEFARFQALQFSDLLRVSPTALSEDRSELFSEWITESIEQNLPFDQVTRALLTARGDSRSIAPANYFAAIPDLESIVETTAQIFMGSRIQCAKCHNHPFENWTQEDYYRIGAVFKRVQRDEGLIKMAENGEMTHPRTGKALEPWGIGAASDPRDRFSEWLTAEDNPYFARVVANRIWAHLMGRGIVEPVDDFRSSNPPANSLLLDALAHEFQANHFDRKHLFRLICNSQVYQRQTRATAFNQSDETQFSHARVRLLTAEQLKDAIAMVTGSVSLGRPYPRAMAEVLTAKKARLDQLDRDQAEWERIQITQIHQREFRSAGFRVSNFFKGSSGDEVYNTAFLNESTLPTAFSEQPWRMTEYSLGEKLEFSQKQPGAQYLYLPLHSKRCASIRFEFQVDDSVVAWCNGEVFYDSRHPQDPLKPTEGKAFLKSGWNEMVFKAMNHGGAFHIQIKPVAYDGHPQSESVEISLPDWVQELLTTPRSQRTPDQEVRLRQYHHSKDEVLSDLLQTQRRYYQSMATQRAWPEQSDFLKAFGQPERMTPCTCERSGEPTLEQSLQLLNGPFVYDQIRGSAEHLQGLDDEHLIQELYWTAFSRPPTREENHTAKAYLKHQDDRHRAIQDLVWVIVNCQEFMFQH